MKKLAGLWFVSTLALAGGGEDCVKCCNQPAPKPKVIVKTVTKEVPKIVEKRVEVPVDRVVEKVVKVESKKNTISIVVGGGSDRFIVDRLSDSLFQVRPRSVGLLGARYSRELFESFELGGEAITNYHRIGQWDTIIETATVSLGYKF